MDVNRLKQLAAQGYTRMQAAEALGVTRQQIWRISKAEAIVFAIRPTHVHGPGRRPAYVAGCEDCRLVMRTWAKDRYHRVKQTS